MRDVFVSCYTNILLFWTRYTHLASSPETDSMLCRRKNFNILWQLIVRFKVDPNLGVIGSLGICWTGFHSSYIVVYLFIVAGIRES